MITPTDLIQQGIAAAQAGRRPEALALLTRAVDENPHSELAWLWLSGVVDDPEDMRVCLDNVLHINPNNTQAQQGRAWLEQRYGPPATAAPAVAPDSTLAPQAPAALAIEPTGGAPTSTPASHTQPAYCSLHEQSDRSSTESPCPYCGQPTALHQKHCSHCHQGLIVRMPPAAERKSGAMTFLALCWLLPVVIGLLSMVVQVFIGISEGVGRGRASGMGILLVIFIVILAGLFYLLLCSPFLLLARGLYRCKSWAYIIQTILTVLELLVIGGLGFVFMGSLREMFRSAQHMQPQLQAFLVTFTSVALGLAFAWRVLIAAMLWFGFGAVYGRKVRFVPHVEVSPQNYNNGLDYRKRGMWYMAVQEWEGAVIRAPQDLEYLHTLALGYAQIRQFDRARTTLNHAIQLAPSNSQLRESRALLDQMAGS